MTIQINNIEHYFDENLVLIAENILENDQVSDLTKHDQGVWTSEVQGFEVEVQVKASKVVAFTCECHKGTEGCSHVVATIMLLRRQLIQENLKKQERSRQSFIPNKLNITAILKQIPDEQIREFVRNYARSDKKFSTAIKAAFIHRVDVIDDNKYLSYLKSILPTKEYKNPSFNSARKLLNAYKTLLEGTEESFALGEFLEVWQCTSSILSFHYPLSDKSNIQKHNFEPIVLNAVQTLTKAYLNTNAPELKEKIEEFTLQEVDKVHYRLESNAFLYWLKLLYKFKEPEKSKIIDLCQKVLLTDDLNTDKKATIFALFFGLIKQWKSLVLFKQWLKDQKLKTALLLKTAETLYLQGSPSDARWILSNINTKNYPKGELLLIKKGLFETEILSENFEHALNIGLDCFKTEPESLYFQRLLELQTKEESKLTVESFNRLIDEVEDLNLHTSLKCELAVAQEDYPKLINILSQHQNLDLYIKLFENIPTQLTEEHQNLVRLIIENYLSEHFGEKPIIKIRKLLNLFSSKGKPELRNNIEDFIQSNYASRKKLIDEILYY
jgi:hypothetical protein